MSPSGPPTTEIAAGETLHRIHAVTNGARFYGRKDATWRWDDPARQYGVLYLGLTQIGPFAETLLRRPAQRAVVWSEIDKRRFARFRTLRRLRLADIHGAGLGWFGVSVAQVAADHDGITFPGAYATTQTISALVHGHTDLDGVQFRSRLDTDHLCLALFERADAAIELVEEGALIDRAWVDQMLKPRGRHVVDL